MSYRATLLTLRLPMETVGLEPWVGKNVRNFFRCGSLPLLVTLIFFTMSASVFAQQPPSGHSVFGAPGSAPGEAVITWIVDDTGNLPIERSRLRYREKFKGSQWHRINIRSAAMSHTLTGLNGDKRYIVQVRVWNAAGGTKWSKGSVFSPASMTETPSQVKLTQPFSLNQLPAVSIDQDGPLTVESGEEVVLSATASDDKMIAAYEWSVTNSLGDNVTSNVLAGAPEGSSVIFETVYSGSYIVTVTVTDNENASASASTMVSVRPMTATRWEGHEPYAITLDQKGPLYVEAGTEVVFSATATGHRLDDLADHISYIWGAQYVKPDSWRSVTHEAFSNQNANQVTFSANAVGVYHLGVSLQIGNSVPASAVVQEVRVHKQNASSDATLSNLKVSTGGGDRAKSLFLYPSFSPTRYEYWVVDPGIDSRITEIGEKKYSQSNIKANWVTEKYGIITAVNAPGLNVTATTSDTNAMIETPAYWEDRPDDPWLLTMYSGQEKGLGPLKVGENSLTVSVTAEDGTAQDYILHVRRKANGTTPPSARISQDDNLTVEAGTDLVFDGSSSTDSDGGDLIGYAWDVYGPRGWNATTAVLGDVDSTNSSVTFNSTAAGTYRIQLMVFDDDGDVGFAERTVTVTPVGQLSLYVQDTSGYEPPRGKPSLVFDVFLSDSASEVVRVFFSTKDGSAVAGEDYVATSGSLRFVPGEIRKRVSVTILDDAHDDSNETFSLILTDADGAVIGDDEAIATILNTDPMPAAWLARYGRIVADQALDGISARMNTSREAGFKGSMAGQSLTTNFEVDASAWESKTSFDRNTGVAKSQAITVDQLLLGSSFSLTEKADSSGGTLAFWGRGAQTRFDGQEGDLTLDGSVSTWMIGTDYDRDSSTVGLSLLRSKGKGDYASGQTAVPMSGQIESSLSAAVPWALWRASERLEVWGATGFGSGDLTLTPNEATAIETDLDWKMAAAGLRTEFSAVNAEAGSPGLALTADALWAQTSSDQTTGLVATESDATRVRVGLESNWIIVQEEGKYLKPQVEVGIRHDGGDGDVGAGIDIGGGISWNDSETGLSVEVEGRTLLTHESDSMKESGYAASVAFDSDPLTDRGMSISLRQDWGDQASGGIDALFATDPLTRRSDDGDARELWTAEAAYGYTVLGGRFTSSPHTGFSQSTTGNEYKIGWRLTSEQGTMTDLSLGLRASRLEKDGAEPDHRIGFEFTTRW